VHYGDAKQLPWATPQPFQGSSSTFRITRNPLLLKQLLAAAGPSVEANAAAELQQSELCRLVHITGVPQAGVVAGNSSKSGVPRYQQLQEVHQAAELQRLGCRLQRR
jgi:hypothetical protein